MQKKHMNTLRKTPLLPSLTIVASHSSMSLVESMIVAFTQITNERCAVTPLRTDRLCM
jgi:hypothetical protein